MRELYHGQSGRCSLRQRTVLNKRILETLSSKRGGPGVDSLLHRVDQYRFQLRVHGLRHHHVKYAVFNRKYASVLLLSQLCKLLPVILATIPSLVLFAPVLILSHKISGNKRRRALKTSPFKLKGTDIIASWKILVAMAVAPCLCSLYVALMTYWAYQSRWCSMLPSYIPTHMVPFLGFCLLPAITIVSLYTGEFAVDVLKSLPQFLILLRPGGTRLMEDLFEQQRKLTREVKMFIDSSIVSSQGM